MTTFQIIITIANSIAVIAIPVIAVLLAQKLQDRAERRKDKMQIFKILMTSRIYGWTPDSVHALNIIDFVFVNDKEVRSAWKDLNDKLHVSAPNAQQLKMIEHSQYKLIETISNSLGYKDKITWETIQNPYIPDGMIAQIEMQKQSQQAYMDLISGVNKMITGNKPGTDEESIRG